jgi:hypothetical protein
MNITWQHAQFLKRYRGSAPGVLLVTGMYLKKPTTVSVLVPAMRAAPTAADAPGYTDDGDLFVKTIEAECRRMQVKHLTDRNFTCREEWPFDDVFIANKASIDRAAGDKAAFAYHILSTDMLYMAYVHHQSTRDAWHVVENVLCSNTGNYESFYACPKHLVHFIKVVI